MELVPIDISKPSIVFECKGRKTPALFMRISIDSNCLYKSIMIINIFYTYDLISVANEAKEARELQSTAKP